MNSDLVFDVAQDGWTPESYGVLVAVSLVVWGAVPLVMILDRRRLWSFPARWQLMLLMACLPTAVLGIRWHAYRDAVSALTDGRCRVVEGMTYGYSLRQEGKKFVESIMVGDVGFRYSWYQGTVGYKTTRKEGGGHGQRYASANLLRSGLGAEGNQRDTPPRGTSLKPREGQAASERPGVR